MISSVCPYCEWDLNVSDDDKIGTICQLCKRPYLVVNSEAYKKTIATEDEFVIEAGVLIKYKGISSDIIIPDGVKMIGNSAFEHSITSVLIPNGVSIIAGAFKGCASLRSISIPNSVKSIYSRSFLGCSSLKKINLPEGLEEIEDWAFCGCRSLAEIKVPSSVKTIEKAAFATCSNLKIVDLPEGLEKIGRHTFDSCISLEEIRIPSSVSEIGAFAFAGCKKLAKIKLDNTELLSHYAVIGTPYAEKINHD